MTSFAKTRVGYRNMWASMTLRPDKVAALTRTAKVILGHKERYQKIEAMTGVPWFVIGVIHYRESSNSFTTHLHNGDPLKARTRQVPAGRPATGSPPFTFEESAYDALTKKPHELHLIDNWDIARIGFELERYNGWGYFGRLNSPYLWSGSNHYSQGKYVADGKFSASHVDAQLGTMAILKQLSTMAPDVAERLQEPRNTPAPPMPPVAPPKPAQTFWERLTGWMW